MPSSSSSRCLASAPQRPRLAAPPSLLLVVLLLTTVCMFCISPVAALTREQAEQVDWLRRGVGSVTSAFFVNRSARGSSSSSEAAAAADSILVAAAAEGTVELLESSSGEIVWRKVQKKEREEEINQTISK